MAEQLPFADVSLATNPEPRCPCVLLLDVSGSMSEVVADSGKDLGYTIQQDGKTYNAVQGGVTRIDLLNQGIEAYRADVQADPLASQRVEVSVVTFGGNVNTVVDFVTAGEFSCPVLTANGGTPMGAGIRQAVEAIKQRKLAYKQSGLHY
jgi:uncharacterized protein YegL